MMPTNVRLACCTTRTTSVFQLPAWRACGADVLPSVLLSYAYRRVWEPLLPTLHIRDYVLDSGAFTAHSLGVDITVEELLGAVQRYQDEGRPPAEVFALDVIGDWRGTKANTERMWAAGVQAIPAFHYGEPEDVLVGYARDYPKIALGGVVGINKKEKMRWVTQCFARVWPKPIHGFGMGLWALEKFPFHSIDCSDWEGSAARFGRWNAFGGATLGLGGKVLLDNLAIEAQHWLDHEQRGKSRWQQVMQGLGWTGTEGRHVI